MARRSFRLPFLLLSAVCASAAVGCAKGDTIDKGDGSSDPTSGGAGIGGAGVGGDGVIGGSGNLPIGGSGVGAAGVGGAGVGGLATGGEAVGGTGVGGAGPNCGNGAVDPGEQCDGTNLAGQTCASVLGFPGASGSVSCSAACTLVSTSCAACGDGYLQSGEQCDDGNAATGDGCQSCQVVCVGDEVQFGLKCYADVASATSRASAHAACAASLGGHLATIGSGTENDVVFLDVMTFATTSARWIDLSDQASEGTFVWSTGEAVSFTNWASGEPNNGSGAEDCVEFRFFDNEWNDAACGGARPFICEYEPPVLHP